MAYSNRFFLRRRTKELGIYALLGYRKFTILSLLTFENVLICSGAFIIGLVLEHWHIRVLSLELQHYLIYQLIIHRYHFLI